MEIFEVKDKLSTTHFRQVTNLIYKHDTNYIPHLKQDIDKVFDQKKNKLFEEGKAIRYILKADNGQVVGRIAAFVNATTAHTFAQPTGGIGFFECIDNQDAANLLFDAGKNWLLQNGMEAMDGPINFGDKNMFWGCLTHNFTDMNSYGMNYNPNYYQSLFESYGFETYFEQFCYKRDIYLPAQPIFVRKYNLMMRNPEYKIANIRGRKLSEVGEEFRQVYNGAWGGHDGFKEMTREAGQKLIKALKPVLDPDIIIFVYFQGKPIGFYINIPELNEIFKFVNGDMNLFGKVKFLYHKWRHTPKTMVGIVFGVIREFQGQGVEGAMIKFAEDTIVPFDRYYETVITWIGDFNPKMLKVTDSLGGYRYRTLKTFRYLFDRTKPFERCPIIE